jgi:glycosyltransferase involved in cell wall biosynthesis
MASEPYNLVLSFLSTPNFYALVAGQLLARRVPVVVSERFCDLFQGAADRVSCASFTGSPLVVVNSHQRASLARKHPWLQDRLSTIYNGYDLRAFVPPLSEPNNSPLKILTIASVSPYKNGLCLVEALGILRQQYNLLPCATWIGQRVMSGERLRYLNQMEQKIAEYGLERQWQWLDQRSDIVSQLHQHDVLVHPSYGEGLPNVVCEALACARPVIVSDTLIIHDLSNMVPVGIYSVGVILQIWRERSSCLTIFRRKKGAKMGQHGRAFGEEHLSLIGSLMTHERLFQTCYNGKDHVLSQVAGQGSNISTPFVAQGKNAAPAAGLSMLRQAFPFRPRWPLYL